MKVLVDTSVWSLSLRRGRPASLTSDQTRYVAHLSELIRTGQAVLTGAICQELLSGIAQTQQFEALRHALRGFESLAPTLQDHETAAQAFNLCRSKGVQGSNTDFLICALAMGRDLPIFTTDKDFLHFQQHLPIALLNMP